MNLRRHIQAKHTLIYNNIHMSCIAAVCAYISLYIHVYTWFLLLNILFILCVFHVMRLNAIHFPSLCIHPLLLQPPAQKKNI